MSRPAIEQATCTDCGETGDFSSNMREVTSPDDDETEVRHTVECECGNIEGIIIDEEGTHATDGIDYADASWNNVEDDDNE